ncbi:MAG TPA: hypothetical protein VIA08_04540 [Nitrososphaeraceae archaeon]|jgi:hypothetical protein
MRRALVSLPDGAWDIIDQLKPHLGNADSEIVRNIVLAYFIEKGYLLKSKGKKESIANEEIASELDIQETMITTLAEMLEEKGQLNYQEWERRVQKKLHK